MSENVKMTIFVFKYVTEKSWRQPIADFIHFIHYVDKFLSGFNFVNVRFEIFRVDLISRINTFERFRVDLFSRRRNL